MPAHAPRPWLALPAMLALALPLVGQSDCDPDPVDADGDGYAADAGDCDDADPDVHPGAEDACADGIDGDCDGFDGLGLEKVQAEVFGPSCVSCHGAQASGTLDLREGRSYGNTVGVPAKELPSMARVSPGAPEDSYLMHKLWGSHRDVGGSGNQMPLGSAPLPDASLTLMEAWIAQGAPEACGVITPTPGPVDTFYYGDVQPILWANCQGCHTAGGIAPIPLDTYEDARDIAAAIASATGAGRMPPWMPADACGTFEGQRILSPEDIATLARWEAQGAAEGDPALDITLPPPKDALPRVDMTVDPGGSYTPSGSANDDYHCFVLDPALADDTFLTGFNFLPGARSMVHHVLLFSADRAEARSVDAQTPGIGYTCFGGPGLANTAVVGAWVPGSSATLYPPETGVQLRADQVIVAQIHYNTTYTEPVADRSRVELMLEPEVAKTAEFHNLLNSGFSIPPNTSGYTAEASLVAPIDFQIHGIAPHMHELGVRGRAWIDRPIAADQCLIDIPAWDFNWQQVYFYDFDSGPVTVRAGETLKISCEWDNFGDLPVTWGEGTQDEMCITYAYITF